MSNHRIKVLVQVECRRCECKYTMTSDISARIGDGGCIDIDFDPVYPDNWYHYEEHMEKVCPACAAVCKERDERMHEVARANRALRENKVEVKVDNELRRAYGPRRWDSKRKDWSR